MDGSVCTAFCAGLSGLLGDNGASVLMMLGTSAAVYIKSRRDLGVVKGDVQQAKGRAERAEGRAQQAEERAQRATEHAQLLMTRAPPVGYEMVMRPSDRAPEVEPIAPQLERDSEPEAAFSTRNYEHIRAQIGLEFDEHGNRRPPRLEPPSPARGPREPQPPKRR